MKGPLKGALAVADIADIMAFDMIPFGQGMWNTEKCGEMNTSSYVWGKFWEGYDANARLCFNTVCGAEHASFYGPRPAECFDPSKGPYCQHGGAECAVNAIQACARKLSKNSYTEFAPFAVCFEENYAAINEPAGATDKSTFAENRSFAEVAINATMEECVKGTSFSSEDLLTCFYENEVEMLQEMAAATVPHITVPFVRITQCNGSFNILVIPDDPVQPKNLLIDAVCDAACEGSNAANKCQQLQKRLAV